MLKEYGRSTWLDLSLQADITPNKSTMAPHVLLGFIFSDHVIFTRWACVEQPFWKSTTSLGVIDNTRKKALSD